MKTRNIQIGLRSLQPTKASAAALIALAIFLLCAPPASAANCAASITSVSGECSVMLKSKGDSDWVDAKSGACLQKGDMARTGKDGKMSLHNIDGTERKMASLASVTIGYDSGKTAGIILNSGEIVVKVAKTDSSFSVKTPSAVMGVRGTEFSVNVDQTGKTDVHVLDGLVSVLGDLGEVLAQAGVAAEILKGALPETSKFDIGKYTEILNMWQGGITVGKVRDFVKQEVKKKVQNEVNKKFKGF